MKRARYYSFLLGILALAALLWLVAAQVNAGGWAVITLDHLPETPTANQPFEISFVVRQHGRHLMTDLTPQVTATHLESRETVEVTAQAQKDAGRYAAVVTLPHSGRWRWSIQAFTMETIMPDLDVLAESSNRAGGNGAEDWSIWMGMLGFIGMAASTALWWRKRVWWTTLIVLTAGSMGTVGLAMSVNPQATVAEKPHLVSGSDLGDKLFVAKGCITCHYHDAIDTDTKSLHTGPNLTNFAASPEYLRLWLKDPAAVKPNTIMPNLNLSDPEIEALITLFAPSPNDETAAEDCPVTPTFIDEPPRDPNADPFGPGPWYINADRTIWALATPSGSTWGVGGEKVLWIRPQGTELEITGHRLDASAPPLRAKIPCCYPTNFQVTGLHFPTEGCWQINASAGESTLDIIVEIET